MQAIAIEVNGKFLDLQDANVRLEIVNPLFITDIYQGDYSFPFEAPATQHNIEILGFAHLPDTTNRVTDFTAVLYLFGLPKYNCILHIVKARERGFSLSLTGSVKALQTVDKKLSEIDLGADYNLGNTQDQVLATAKITAEEGGWSAYGFTFVPFYMPDFYRGTNPDFQGVVNRVDSTTGELVGNPLTGTFHFFYTQVPFLFLFYLLSRIWKAEKLTPKGTFWNNPEMSTLLITNNRSLDVRVRNNESQLYLPYEGYAEYTTDNELIDFTPSWPGGYDVPSAWDDSQKKYIIQSAGKFYFNFHFYFRPHSTTGRVNLDGGTLHVWYNGSELDVIIMDPSYANGASVFDDAKDEWFHIVRTYEVNASSGDIGNEFYVEYITSSMFNTWLRLMASGTDDVTRMYVNIDDTSLPARPDTFVKFKNHVPDWTVGELLAEVKKLGVSIDFDFAKSEVTMDLIPDIIRSTTGIELTGRAESRYEMNMEERGKGFELSYEFDETDNMEIVIPADRFDGEIRDNFSVPAPAFEGNMIIITATNRVLRVEKAGTNLNTWNDIGGNYKPHVIGAGTNKIKCKLSPVRMVYANNEGGTGDQNTALMPYLEGSGSSDLFGLGINDHKPKLCFWRGLNRDPGVTTPRGGIYVLASSQNLGTNGEPVGDYTLRLDKTNGLLRSNNDALLNAMNEAVYVEKDLYLEPLDMEKIRSTSKLILDFNLYLLKNLSLVLSKTVAKAHAVLLKL